MTGVERKPLTGREQQVFDMLVDVARADGPCPKNAEIGDRFDIYPSSMPTIIARLQSKGHAAFDYAGRARRATLYLDAGETIMTDWSEPKVREAGVRPRHAKKKVRKCLCCPAEFISEGPGHRMCAKCRRSAGSATGLYGALV